MYCKAVVIVSKFLFLNHFSLHVYTFLVPATVSQLPAFMVLVSLQLLPVQYSWVTFSGNFVSFCCAIP